MCDAAPPHTGDARAPPVHRDGVMHGVETGMTALGTP